MQQYILSKKNVITVISGLLIVLGFFSHFVLENVGLSEWSLIIASVFGITPIAIQAFQAMKVKVISIDVLVSIAAIGALFIQNYEESAIVTFLFLFGHYLEQRTLNQTRSAIKELTEMAPESALKQMDNGEFEEVEVDDIDEGDILLVKTGAKVPVDGIVLTGEGHINEASITGEAVPVNKLADAEVFAGTILETERFKSELTELVRTPHLEKLLNSWKKHKILNPKRNGSLIAFLNTTHQLSWFWQLLYGRSVKILS